MKFLQFRTANRSPNRWVDRRLVILIGPTTKRDTDDDETIGFLGSGLKLAAVFGLRHGISIRFSSTDQLGPYLLEFTSQKELIGPIVQHPVLVTHHHPKSGDGAPPVPPRSERLGITHEAFSSWDKTIGDDMLAFFPLLRETLANTIDADRATAAVTVVDSCAFAPKGWTHVYIPLEPIRDDWETIKKFPERYYKCAIPGIGKPPPLPLLKVAGVGAIYNKAQEGVTRVFGRPTLIGCSADLERSSVFDYSLVSRKPITDDRHLHSWLECAWEVAKILCALEDSSIAMVIIAAVVADKANLERNAFKKMHWLTDGSKAAWRHALQRIFGNKMAIPSRIVAIDENVRQVHGYKLVTELPKAFLEKIGIPHAKSIIPQLKDGEYEIMRFQDFDDESRKRFQSEFRMFAKHFPSRARRRIIFYLPFTDELGDIGAFTRLDDVKKDIWIAAQSRTKLRSCILQKLPHENRHQDSGAGDYDRRFVQQADKDEAMMIYRAEGCDMSLDGEVIPPYGDPGELVPNIFDPGPPSSRTIP